MIESWTMKPIFQSSRFLVEQTIKDPPKMGDGTIFPIPCPDDYFPVLREVHCWIFDTKEEAMEKIPNEFRPVV